VAVSDSLIDTLSAHGADATTVPHAVRYYVSARTDDLPEPEMRERLVRAGVSEDQLARALDLLEHDAALLDGASLCVLQDGFADSETRGLVDGAIGASRSKLPVVEAGLIAIAVVYGMWLATTKGRRSHQRVIRRGWDGSLEEIETTEWYGPSGPLQAIAGLFGVEGGDEQTELPPGDERGLPPADDA
jgi:hypothetical protein